MERHSWILVLLLNLYVYGCNALTLSTNQAWRKCKLADSTVFCNKEGKCDANNVLTGAEYTLESDFTGPARVDANVKWIKVIKDNGCKLFSQRRMDTHTFEDNSILECMRTCELYRFALQGKHCYCLSRSMRQANETLCNAPCPGKPTERCGSSDGRYVSYFHQLPIKVPPTGEDRSLPMEKVCGIYRADKLNFRPCGDRHPFFCYSEETRRNIEGAAELTWTGAVEWCRKQGLRLGNPGEIPSDMHRTKGCWVGSTKYHELQWDKGQAEFGDGCVALSKKGEKYQFEAIECESNTPGLCINDEDKKLPTTLNPVPTTKNPKTTTTTVVKTTRKSSSSKPITTAKQTTKTITTSAPATTKPQPSTADKASTSAPEVKTTKIATTSAKPAVISTSLLPTNAPTTKDTAPPSPTQPVEDKVKESDDDIVATGQLSETEKDNSSFVYIVSAVASVLVIIAVVVIVILICRKRRRKEGASHDEENTPVKTEESSRLLGSDASESSPVSGGKPVDYSETNGDTKTAPEETTPADGEGYAHLIENEKRDDEALGTFDHMASNGISDDTQNLLEKEQNGTVNQQEVDAEVYKSSGGDENKTETRDNSRNVEESNGTADEIKKENG